jgi:hypothetical protein
MLMSIPVLVVGVALTLVDVVPVRIIGIGLFVMGFGMFMCAKWRNFWIDG